MKEDKRKTRGPKGPPYKTGLCYVSYEDHVAEKRTCHHIKLNVAVWMASTKRRLGRGPDDNPVSPKRGIDEQENDKMQKLDLYR